MRTQIEISPPDAAILDQLTPTSRDCIKRLLQHQPQQDLSDVPLSRLAAVLVLLYEKSGALRVLLTTRSKSLRTHAGQTALPGGRVDASDANMLDTARREAFEEVDLPLDCPSIHPLCMLAPSVSLHGLVVTPVVALLSDVSVLELLKAAEHEVSRIFTYPLEVMLDPSMLLKEPKESLVPMGSEDWPYPEELHNLSDHIIPSLGNISYRNHRFRSSASPVKGLTSDILIQTAGIAYGYPPKYERYGNSVDQLRGFASVRHILLKPEENHKREESHP